MRPELTGCIQLPTGTVKLELTPATQALIWRCHFSPLAFVFLSLSLSLPSYSVTSSIYYLFHFPTKPESKKIKLSPLDLLVVGLTLAFRVVQ